MLVLLYMFLPIFFVVLMSFNDPASRLSYEFDGFTLDNWLTPASRAGMCASVVTSLQIGFLATLGATVLGTLVAFALVRHRFRGRAATSLLIFLPMATPEVVMGSSLLALFTSAGLSGSARLLVDPGRAHHVLPVVRGGHRQGPAGRPGLVAWSRRRWTSTPTSGRRSGGSPSRWCSPGILAAALLSFSLSFDDFIVTNFNHGNTITFPMFVWGSAQRGIPPQVNVIGTVMFLVALALVLGGSLLQRRRPA